MKKHRQQVLFSGIITAVGRTVCVLLNPTFPYKVVFAGTIFFSGV